MDMCHPNHEKKNKKCFWDLHGFNESDEPQLLNMIKDENDHHEHHESCVGEVLEAILHAQKKAKKQHDCDHSCKESISELLERRKETKKIQFLLYFSAGIVNHLKRQE